jgi:hypothetical protein
MFLSTNKTGIIIGTHLVRIAIIGNMTMLLLKCTKISLLKVKIKSHFTLGQNVAIGNGITTSPNFSNHSTLTFIPRVLMEKSKERDRILSTIWKKLTKMPLTKLDIVMKQVHMAIS